MRPMRQLCVVIAVVASLSATVASAQESRPAMVDSARALINDFNELQSFALLRRALDPALGAPDASWARGVLLLGQTLLQKNQREEAVSWLRWALRRSPTLQADSVTSTPALVTALQEARAFVAASGTEPRVSLRFEWATATTSGGFGDLRVARGAGDASGPVQLSVNGAFLDEGRPLRLSPGSYRVAARASGQSDAEFTTEVLPGVTTMVTITFVTASVGGSRAVEPLRPTFPPAVEPLRPTLPPAVVPKASKGRSKLWAVAAGVAGVGIVAVLAMPKSAPGPTTGGIVLRLP